MRKGILAIVVLTTLAAVSGCGEEKSKSPGVREMDERELMSVTDVEKSQQIQCETNPIYIIPCPFY